MLPFFFSFFWSISYAGNLCPITATNRIDRNNNRGPGFSIATYFIKKIESQLSGPLNARSKVQRWMAKEARHGRGSTPAFDAFYQRCRRFYCPSLLITNNWVSSTTRRETGRDGSCNSQWYVGIVICSVEHNIGEHVNEPGMSLFQILVNPDALIPTRTLCSSHGGGGGSMWT